MNNIITNLISDPLTEQPFLGPSLNFLQGAAKDSLNGIALSLIGPTYSASTVYILSGCVNSQVLPSYTISAGYVFFNGEIYFCPAVTGTVAGGSTLYSAADTYFSTVSTPDPVTGITVDPVQFSDGSTNPVHQVRNWKIQPLTTGTGLNGFSTFAQLYSGRSIFIVNAASQTISSASPTWVDLTSITFTTPNDNKTRLYAIFFKCRIDESNSSANAFVEFQLLQGSTQLDVTSAGKSNGTSTDVYLIPASLGDLVLVPPNTIVKVQSRRTTADCTVYNMKLFAFEIF